MLQTLYFYQTESPNNFGGQQCVGSVLVLYFSKATTDCNSKYPLYPIDFHEKITNLY